MIDRSVMSLAGVRRILGLLMGLSALRAALIVSGAWGLSRAAVLLWEGGAVSGSVWWALLFLVSFTARQGTVFAEDRILSAYAANEAAKLREQLMRKLFTLGLAQKHGTGSLAATALEGMEQVETYLKLILAKMAAMALVPGLILAAVFVLDWVSGLILLGVFPLILVFMVLLGKTAREKAERQYKSFQSMSNHFVDSLRGIGTLRLFGLSRRHAKSVFRVSERFREATMQTLRVAILSSFALDFFCTLSVAIVAVGLGLRLLFGVMRLLPALAALMLAPEYFLPIRDFAGDYHATLDGKNALASVLAILAEPELPEEEAPLPEWGADSTLEIRGLSFAYGGFTAIKDLSLTARGFQKIGVIGLSGAGKSTLMGLLGGFMRPDESEITVDGRALSSFHSPDWQRQVVYIPQNPYIFHATLGENIAFYHPGATEDEILGAARAVGLTELIAELPDKLGTKIGEGARALSGGQAQRVALARALLDDSRRILLFDEPTAHLDVETEAELKERMLPLMEGKLVFFATHRLHWMRDMDAVLVMEGGRIVEAGPAGELLPENGPFARLAGRAEGGTP